MSTTEYENSHSVSVTLNHETFEVAIQFVQGEGPDAITHTLRTKGVVSHEATRKEPDGA